MYYAKLANNINPFNIIELIVLAKECYLIKYTSGS